MSSGARQLDVARVRGLFPGLSDGLVHPDGPGGALVPESVVRAVSQSMRVPIADPGGVFASSARAEQLDLRRPLGHRRPGRGGAVGGGARTQHASLTATVARAVGKHLAASATSWW